MNTSLSIDCQLRVDDSNRSLVESEVDLNQVNDVHPNNYSKFQGGIDSNALAWSCHGVCMDLSYIRLKWNE